MPSSHPARGGPCLSPVSAWNLRGFPAQVTKLLLRTQQNEGKFLLSHWQCNCESGSVPDWLPGATESISLTWIWKTISVKSLGPFSDIYMLSNSQQTTYVTLRCSVVLRPLPKSPSLQRAESSLLKLSGLYSAKQPFNIQTSWDLILVDESYSKSALLPLPHPGGCVCEFMTFYPKSG